ncbi:MAG: ion transporter [Bacteroidota bacterium]
MIYCQVSPTLIFLRAGRTLRLIRILRILRAFRSTKHLVNHVFNNKAQGALTTVAILAVILLIFSSISILQFEDAPNSNIKPPKMPFGGPTLR